MKENNTVVEMKNNEAAAEVSLADQKVTLPEETTKRGFWNGVKTIAKPVGKALMFIGIGAVTVFGVFAVLGKAPSLNGDDVVDTVENEDDSFSVKETTEPQSECSSEE